MKKINEFKNINEKTVTKYESSNCIFKEINPQKKFSKFTFYELDEFDEVNVGDCFKDTILKVNDKFYEFKKTIKILNDTKTKGKIIFKDRNGKTVFEKEF